MTNREWLNSLSNEDLVNWIYADETHIWNPETKEDIVFAPSYSPCLHEVIRTWTSATFRLKQWLEEERVEDANKD